MENPCRLPPSIDDQIRRAYGGPCPTAYNVKKSETSGGRMSEARLPSALDHGAYQKSFVPGPGSYDTPDLRDFPLPDGGRLNRIPPQERLKLVDDGTGPGQYGVPADPTLPRQLYGSFGKDPRITKFIQEEVMRSKGMPAPGEHDVMEAMENVRPFCPEGGRYMEQGRGHGYFDSAAKLGEGKPGPDRYNLPGAIRPNKTAGKLVWKYKSETVDSTKRIITKVVGNGCDNPAPGHYTLPDPAPVTPFPTIKGRETGPPMPHPFAYNCAPDHGQKYTLYTSVRDQNSGDQIFGRDLKRGAMSKEDRAARARAAADEVAGANLPTTMAERDVEQPGESAQWKTGGFSTLKRAKSAPGMQRNRLHPVVEETMAHYPALSKHHGRADRTFAPMASRRFETINTSKRHSSYQSLQTKKWEIKAIAAALENSTALAMEPLDERRLREEATLGLMDKAEFRMRMEGLSAEQAELVLAEFPGVLAETDASAAPSPAASTFLDPLAEPFLENVPRAKSKASAAGEPVSEPVAQAEPMAEPLATAESVIGVQPAEPFAEP